MTDLAQPNAGEVHVHLVRPGPVMRSDSDLLSVSERSRLSDFANSHRAEQFAAGRIVLRTILASYLGTAPSAVRLEAAPHDKPRLVEETLEFNMSHRSGLTAIAVSAAGAPVGIDVDGDRRPGETAAVYERASTVAERQRLDTLDGDARQRALLELWVRKEAMLKWIGAGLRVPPAHIETPGRVAAEGTLTDLAGRTCRLWDIPVPNDMVGAVATAPTVSRLVLAAEAADRLDER